MESPSREPRPLNHHTSQLSNLSGSSRVAEITVRRGFLRVRGKPANAAAAAEPALMLYRMGQPRIV